MVGENLNVFVSYSHSDQAWLKRVQVHLRPLARDGQLALWDDTRIRTGQHWREEIKAALGQADVAVLLISADFFASDFIANNELPPLLEAARERGLIIGGVHINYSRFDRDRVLSDYQTVNTPNEPIEGLSRAQQEKVFDNLACRIEALLKPNLARAAAVTGPGLHLPPNSPKNHLTLLAALRARAERSGHTVLGAEEVRAVGAAVGLADAELIAVLDVLAGDQQLIRIQWGGEVHLLESQRETGERSGGGRPSLSGIFHGPVIVSTGEGAQIDARGSGHGAAYKPGEARPEAAFGVLAAAVVELQMRLAEFESDAAAQVRALEAAAREVAEQGAQAEPDKATLGQRLQALTARLDDVAKLQSAVTKLEPTLTMMKSAGAALKTWLLGS